jgi:hypothetical protein
MQPANAKPATPKPAAPRVPAKVDPNQVDISDFNIGGISFPGKKGGNAASASRANTTSKIAYEREKARLGALQKSLEGKALKDFLEGTIQYEEEDGTTRDVPIYQTPYEDLRLSLQNLRTEEEGSLKDQYDIARENLKTLYGQAKTTTETGYKTLNDWLAANAPRAYADATRATAVPMANALAAYQAAQGVSSAPVDAQIAAMNVAGQGGAANYNNLLDVLRRAETTSQASRLAEAQMAANLAQGRLTAGQTAGLGGLTQQQAAALATLAQRYGQRGMDIETSAANRYNTLVDRLIGLAGYDAVSSLLGRR